MQIREAKVLLSTDRLGRVAIVARGDGRFCLYEHWRWSVDTQRAAGVLPVTDARWTTAFDADLYVDAAPLPGLYATIAQAETEARRLLGLGDG